MVTSRAKLPTATIANLPDICTAEEWPWSQIERAYGHKLPQQVRQRIWNAFSEFALWRAAESRAVSLTSVKKRISKARRSIVRLVDELERPVPNDDLNSYVAVLLADHGWAQQRLLEVLNKHRHICDQAIKEIDLSSVEFGYREGNAWNRFVRSLTRILEKSGLPVAASKGFDKSRSGQASPFVRLMKALPIRGRTKQSGYSYHDRHSDDMAALAQAISRARKPPARKQLVCGTPPRRYLEVVVGDMNDDSDIFVSALGDLLEKPKHSKRRAKIRHR